MGLRPYQVESVEALRANIRRGIRRQILCSPTGSGKTECAMDLVARSQAKGARTYFICDRQTLVHQTSQRFHGAGIDHGVLMGDQTRRAHHGTIIASAQTLESRGFTRANAPEPDLVIIDEVHEQRKRILAEVADRNIITVGLTATPFTPGLAESWQDVVNVTTTQKLIAAGFLCPLKVVGAASEVDVQNLEVSSTGEWVQKSLGERVMRITGDMVPEWEKHTSTYFGGPQPTIVFCPTVADSESAAEKFRDAGYDFQVVSYRQRDHEKAETIQRFREGRHLGLVSCIALTKGFDAPQTRVLIDASPIRKSFALHIQKVGRVMRIADGKPFGLVIDMAGNWLGFYDRTHAFFAEGCSELPAAGTKSEPRKAPPKDGADPRKCHECGYIFPPGTREEPQPKACPICGAERKRGRGVLQAVAGELGQLDVVDGGGRKLPFSGDWWPELCAVASAITDDDEKARRIALAKFRAIFHRWPRGEFVRLDRAPDRAVADYTRRQYQRYLVAKRKAS